MRYWEDGSVEGADADGAPDAPDADSGYGGGAKYIYSRFKEK